MDTHTRGTGNPTWRKIISNILLSPQIPKKPVKAVIHHLPPNASGRYFQWL
jgi:hypothetical protein